MKHPRKSDFPASRVRRYLEPGPIVLVSSKWKGKTISRRSLFRPEMLGQGDSEQDQTFGPVIIVSTATSVQSPPNPSCQIRKS